MDVVGNSVRAESYAFFSIMNSIISGVSLVGSLWMCFHSFRNTYKSATYRLITYIAMADLWYSVPNLLSTLNMIQHSWVCLIQGYMGQYFFILSMFLSSSLALMSYKSLRGIGSGFNSNRFMTRSVLACMTYSFILATAPFLFTSFVNYENHGLFCSVGSADLSASRFQKILIVLIFQGIPFLIGFLLTLIFYCKTVESIRNMLGSMFISTRVKAYYKVFWYPVVMLLVFVPNIAFTLVNTVLTERILWIEVIHILLTNSLGFLNTLVYGSLFLGNNTSASIQNESELLPSRNLDIYQPLRRNNPRERGEVIRQLFEEPESSGSQRDDNRNFLPESQPSTHRSFNSNGSESEI